MAQEDNHSAPISDSFILALVETGQPVSIYMVNGIQLKGTIKDMDRYTIKLEGQGTQLIYKHAISTIMAHGPGPN